MESEQEKEQLQAEGEKVDELSSIRQSQLATILIGLLVIIAGFLTYNYLQSRQAQNTAGEVTSGLTSDTTPTQAEEKGEIKGTYVVKAGDTLSSIAEEVYGSSQNWREIAQANEIALDQPVIQVGQELKLPAIGGPDLEGKQLAQAEEEPTVEPTSETVITPTTIEPTTRIEEPEEAGAVIGEEITETPATAVQTYTVAHGDTLWGIAQKIYGDGSRWHKVFDANPLSMYTTTNGHEFPLIHAGNVLVIPE